MQEKIIQEILSLKINRKEDLFSYSGDGNNKVLGFGLGGMSAKIDIITQVITFLSDEIKIAEKGDKVLQGIPVLLDHGVEDEKVSVELGKLAAT